MHATLPLLLQSSFPSITRGTLETLQINLGYKCNQSCVHCHVNAGPARTEMMTRETMSEVIAFASASRIKKFDLTGGAPELNPRFRELVLSAREIGATVIDRCNLTVIEESGQSDLAEFFASQNVEIVASLPCYLEDNVDRQRGKGVFEASLRALRKLNALGYGIHGSGLVLSLVYNPQGPVLPPPQEKLEADYRRELQGRYDISFNRLYVLTNMPIQRFGSMLLSKGQFDAYMSLLKNSYQTSNLDHVMCRNQISIDWRGYVYDCDFNQMLGLPLTISNKPKTHIRDLLNKTLNGNPIAIADHCYGCTAGQGSSCGGALASHSQAE